MLSHKIVEVPLGDVWAYDYALNCWEMITNGLPGGVSFDVKMSHT
jgi:hypothetical protein